MMMNIFKFYKYKKIFAFDFERHCQVWNDSLALKANALQEDLS